jgi:tetratricopeptide (TPR) repeat protein
VFVASKGTSMSSSIQPAARPVLRDAKGQPYEPALKPHLKPILFLVFAATALLGITGVYLSSIRLLEWWRGQTYTNQFTLWMFLAHIAVGVLILAPFLYFGVSHYLSARRRKNRLAVRLGLTLFATGLLVVLSGVALIQLAGLPQLPVGSWGRNIIYVLHLAAPAAAVVLYVLHRRAGPDIQWRYGIGWGAGVAVFVGLMIAMHSQDPRKWYVQGSKEGERYFEPSKARTHDGNFIPANTLMMDEYCKKCHEDIFNDHLHSAHKFSSFNNPPYRFSVRETRKMGLERDGNTKASRWCAGCHDTVPFFSGAFDDPEFDDVNHPTSQAGITCTTCHAITNINSTMGNADYTIEEPQHYPFAYSENPFLQWVNNQLVKAKPDFHKKTFLKPFHKSATNKSAEFCSTCHKVSLPVELNHYKEFTRGQDHYTTYLLSGVSGHGARSFYYPPVAKTSCAECHMPLKESGDFGAKDFDNSGARKIHSHAFPAANTGLPWLLSLDPKHADRADKFRAAAKLHEDFLRGTDPEGKDKKIRIDLFGLKEGGTIDAKLIAPLRPKLPALKPGATYLVEVVVRTLNIGHPLTQGTVDSNEIWVDFTARSGDRVIGRSGALQGKDDSGPLDEWAHRINVLMLDRKGNRINRRNPQDIFTPLYNHQVPPGAGQVVHYRLEVPRDVTGPVELAVKVRYRKFDFEYLSLVHGGDDKVPATPVVDVCEDKVTLPVEGVAETVPEQTSPIKPPWQRWNDYGIGCYIEGGLGMKKGEFRQAEEAFRQMLTLGNEDATAYAHLNMARVFLDEGRVAETVEELNETRRAFEKLKSPPWWTLAWLNGRVNLLNARDVEDFDRAITDFEKVLDPKNQPEARKFDFSMDFVVINDLALAYFKRSQLEGNNARTRDPFLVKAIQQYERTLQLEKEDLDAHYGLHQCYARLGGKAPESAVSEEKVATDEASLSALARDFRDGKTSKEKRLETVGRLAQAVIALGKEPTKADQPKRMRFEALITQLRPAFQDESDAELRAAAARALGYLHYEMYAIFRPDDVARSLAAKEYRAKHPAADHAAEAIVIYPTNQPDR